MWAAATIGAIVGLTPTPQAGGFGILAMLVLGAFLGPSTPRRTVLAMAAAPVTVAAFYLYQPPGYPTGRLAVVLGMGLLAALTAALLIRLAPRVRRAIPALTFAMAVLLLLPTTPQPNLLVDRPSQLSTDLIREYLSTEVRDGRLPAMTFGVADHGEPVLVGSFGRGHPDGPSVDAESTFLIGSMSKSFTALVVAQLAEAGKLDLDDPVDTYLPWYSPRGGPTPSIRSLLDHSSGIPSTAGWKLLAGADDVERSTMDVLNATSLLPVGSVEYSNANYVLLGQVIETTTGSPFAEVVRTEVLDPLGLQSTSAETVVPGRVDGYRMWFGAPLVSPIRPQEIAVPAGFMTSNVPDMLKYLDAVVRGHRRVPSDAGNSVLRATSTAPNSGVGEPFPDQRYAMGWVRGPIAGTDVVWHSGGLADFNSVMVADPTGQWSFVVLIDTAAQVNDLMPTITRNVVSIIGGNQPGRTAGRSLSLLYSLLVPAAFGIVALLVRAVALIIDRPGATTAPRRVAMGVLGLGGALTTILVAAKMSGFPASPFNPSDTLALARVLGTFAPDVAAVFAGLFAVATTLVIRAALGSEAESRERHRSQ